MESNWRQNVARWGLSSCTLFGSTGTFLPVLAAKLVTPITVSGRTYKGLVQFYSSGFPVTALAELDIDDYATGEYLNVIAGSTGFPYFYNVLPD